MGCGGLWACVSALSTDMFVDRHGSGACLVFGLLAARFFAWSPWRPALARPRSSTTFSCRCLATRARRGLPPVRTTHVWPGGPRAARPRALTPFSFMLSSWSPLVVQPWPAQGAVNSWVFPTHALPSPRAVPSLDISPTRHYAVVPLSKWDARAGRTTPIPPHSTPRAAPSWVTRRPSA